MGESAQRVSKAQKDAVGVSGAQRARLVEWLEANPVEEALVGAPVGAAEGRAQVPVLQYHCYTLYRRSRLVPAPWTGCSRPGVDVSMSYIVGSASRGPSNRIQVRRPSAPTRFTCIPCSQRLSLGLLHILPSATAVVPHHVLLRTPFHLQPPSAIPPSDVPTQARRRGGPGRAGRHNVFCEKSRLSANSNRRSCHIRIVLFKASVQGS